MSKKATFATNDFPWEEISEDDYICKIGDYVLRVQQMDVNSYWWKVTRSGVDVYAQTSEHANSKYRAVGLCEGVYMGDVWNNL